MPSLERQWKSSHMHVTEIPIVERRAGKSSSPQAQAMWEFCCKSTLVKICKAKSAACQLMHEIRFVLRRDAAINLQRHNVACITVSLGCQASATHKPMPLSPSDTCELYQSVTISWLTLEPRGHVAARPAACKISRQCSKILVAPFSSEDPFSDINLYHWYQAVNIALGHITSLVAL